MPYVCCLLLYELHASCFMISARSSLSIFDSPTITYANLSYSSHGSSLALAHTGYGLHKVLPTDEANLLSTLVRDLRDRL